MNNLELSNPVAWTDADELADMDCNTYGNIFNAKYIDIHNGRWLPLYSQGYIDFLIAQLEAAQKERDELKELNCHFDLSIRKTEGVNEVLRSKLEAAERALIRPLPIGELVQRLEGQTYEKWFSESDVKDLRERAETAEAALSAAQLDATRWRALLSSPAIRILGHAGLQDDKPIDGHYCHFGMEIWSHHEPYYDNKKAGELITRYADNMIASSLVEGNADAE